MFFFVCSLWQMLCKCLLDFWLCPARTCTGRGMEETTGTGNDFIFTVASCKTFVKLPLYSQIHMTYSDYPNIAPWCLRPINTLNAKKLHPNSEMPQVAGIGKLFFLFPWVCLASKVESDLHYIQIVWELKYWNHKAKDTDSDHISMFYVMKLKHILSQQKCQQKTLVHA